MNKTAEFAHSDLLAALPVWGGDPYSIVGELCVVQPWIFLQERGGAIEADCSGFSFPHCFPGPSCGGGGNMGTMCDHVFFV